MPNRVVNEEPVSSNNWTSREAYLLALVCLLSGLVLGYLIRGSSSPVLPAAGVTQSAPVPTSAPPGGGAPPSAQALEPVAGPLLAAVKADPKNVDALVQLGNLYYDHQVYPEAIEYYRRALELRPNDPNVRTDMGTAHWYSGFPDPAIAEYEKVLKLQPDFAPAMMNMGVVKMEGRKDYAGAIAIWEKLLATHPQLPDRARVEGLMAQARARQGGAK